VEVSATMPLLNIPEHVIDDLNRFISKNYSNNLPNSLLIAQAFILKYPEHGTKYGLSLINYAIEDGIKRGLFNL
jgi:hypothetical protein